MATTFIWKGRTTAGVIQSGEIELGSHEEVLAFLRKNRIIATSVREKPKQIQLRLPWKNTVSTRDLAVFTRQFATMINAGLPLVQCLEILSRQTPREEFREVIEQVTSDVESGATLSESLGRHPRVFDRLYTNMVSAGEAGGILDDILARLATFIEKSNSLKQKVKGALTYPAVVLFVAVGVTVFMLTAIIPTFAKMFSDFGQALPLPTQVVLMASDFIRGFWWALVAGTIALVVAIKRYYTTDGGRHRIDRLLLKIPVLGDVLLKAGVARFTRTLGTLVTSGVPILNGLEITANTAGNVIIADAVMKTRSSIGQGETIARPLADAAVFPPMVVQMIAVGEETGALDQMLTRIADFYDDEVDTAVSALTSVIEPVMIVVMGLIVGGMVVAMYLPMFKLISVVSG
ncbi:MAG: type II secretion system F family protein [Candidatus Eiseniibacteriota bacterium]|jgi:type IV pilus assembly protein PilC